MVNFGVFKAIFGVQPAANDSLFDPQIATLHPFERFAVPHGHGANHSAGEANGREKSVVFIGHVGGHLQQKRVYFGDAWYKAGKKD